MMTRGEIATVMVISVTGPTKTAKGRYLEPAGGEEVESRSNQYLCKLLRHATIRFDMLIMLALCSIILSIPSF
jgi:hypothetical protein